MKSASRYAYLKVDKSSKNLHGRENVDTNVISLGFETLKNSEENLHMGDPFFCKNCKSCLSSTSVLLSKDEYHAKDPHSEKLEEEKKVEPIKPIEKLIEKTLSTPKPTVDNHRVWVCEFCDCPNLLTLDQEEIPKSEDLVYLLKSAAQPNGNPDDINSETTTIFCIDNSGSMSVTQEVKGQQNMGAAASHGLSEEEYEMLKEFIEQGSNQYLPGQDKGISFISRKQCVLSAIRDILSEMKSSSPNKRVGLVTFNDDVCIVGDGKELPEIIKGDHLYNYEVLSKAGEVLAGQLITRTVKDSAEGLIQKFEKLKETGKTALGPALLVSLGLAIQGKQGSRVILCTDGLANVGLGEMDTKEGLAHANEFYGKVADIANQNGISISVISIKGEGCKLDTLGSLADKTSGSVTRVDPNTMGKKMASVMKQEVIGTQANVKLRLHHGMRFRNEALEFLDSTGSLYEKKLGNVTAKTELTFEYELRSHEELVKLGIDISKIKSVPFQAQITYISSSGDQLLRVINKTLKATMNLEQAEKDEKINLGVLAARGLQQQADLAFKGKAEESEETGNKWMNYVEKNEVDWLLDSKSEQVINQFKKKSKQVSIANSRNSKKKVPSKDIPMGGSLEGKDERELMEIIRRAQEELLKKQSYKKDASKELVSEQIDEDYRKLYKYKNSNVEIVGQEGDDEEEEEELL